MAAWPPLVLRAFGLHRGQLSSSWITSSFPRWHANRSAVMPSTLWTVRTDMSGGAQADRE
eukprot:7742595-Pyramimonas_sp.AAC.1